MKLKIGYYILLALGIIGIGNTVVVSGYSNLNFGTILPGAVGGISVLFALLKLIVFKERYIISNVYIRRGIFSIIAIGITSFIWIEALIITNASSEEKECEYVLILGAALKGDNPSLTLQYRLNEGAAYLHKYEKAKVIVSGGQGPGENRTEAEAMKEYLVDKGIAPERIIMEDKATSTFENFTLTKNKLKEQEGKEPGEIMVITNDFHMYRSKKIAERVGFVPHGITTPTPDIIRMNTYLREYFAVVKSMVFDR